MQDYAEDSIVELPKEVQTLIENVLKFLKAEKTDDPAVFTLGKGSDESDDQNQDDNQNDDQNQDNKKEKKDKKGEDVL